MRARADWKPYSPSLKEELLGKGARKAELVQTLASAERPPSLLNPNRRQISELLSAL